MVEMILSAIDDQRSERHGERGPHKCAGVPLGIGGCVVLELFSARSVISRSYLMTTHGTPGMDA